MLSLKAIRAAAKPISDEGREVHFGEVAALLDVEVWRLRRFVESRRYHLKIPFVFDGRFPGLVLVLAADNIRLRGDYVTQKTLRKELGKCHQSISMAFRRHPDYPRILGVISESEANRRRRKSQYATLVPEIVAEKGEATISELSRRAECDRSLVLRPRT